MIAGIWWRKTVWCLKVVALRLVTTPPAVSRRPLPFRELLRMNLDNSSFSTTNPVSCNKRSASRPRKPTVVNIDRWFFNSVALLHTRQLRFTNHWGVVGICILILSWLFVFARWTRVCVYYVHAMHTGNAFKNYHVNTWFHSAIWLVPPDWGLSRMVWNLLH